MNTVKLTLLACFLFVFSQSYGEASICNLCSNNESVSTPEKVIDSETGQSCGELQDIFRSIKTLDKEECLQQQVASYETQRECGCPTTKDSCRICQAGNIIMNPTDEIVIQDNIFPWTNQSCIELDAMLLYVELSNETCTSIQQTSRDICGCMEPQTDPFEFQAAGFPGFSEKKLKAMAWMVRPSALLSIVGSVFIMKDIIRDRTKWNSLYHQLVFGMSFFDLSFSTTLAISTLAMPRYNVNGDRNIYIYGAFGTETTCRIQSFFVQLGHGAFWYSMCLSIYHLLVIRYNWKEGKLNRLAKRPMHIGTCTVGLGLAFASMPFYGPCGNACWVPMPPFGDLLPFSFLFLIPVGFATILATMSMLLIYLKVRKQSQAASKWSVNGVGQKMKKAVANQAFLYLFAFYFCWPFTILTITTGMQNPLGLKDSFWFLFLSCIAFPLQGFLNALVYFQPHFDKSRKHVLQKRTRASTQQRSSNFWMRQKQRNSGPVPNIDEPEPHDMEEVEQKESEEQPAVHSKGLLTNLTIDVN